MSVIATIGTNPGGPIYQFLDGATGEPLASGTWTTYLAGTDTLAGSFVDINLGTPNANPLTLDSEGKAVAYFDPTNNTNEAVAYKWLIKDADGVTQPGYPQDGIPVPVPSAGGFLSTAKVGYGASTTLTIQGGAITPTLNRHMLSPQGGSADDLTDIAVTNLPDGALLILGNTNASATITVKDGTGNITLENGDCELATTSARILLIRQGANWVEVSRSTSSAAGMSPIVLYTNDTPSATVGATPKDLWTQTIPGGTLANDGESLQLIAYGNGASNENTKTRELLVDGVVVNTLTQITVFEHWQMTAVIMRFTETTQGIGSTSADPRYVGGTVDLTADFDIVIRGTGVDNDDIIYRMSIVTKNPVGSLT